MTEENPIPPVPPTDLPPTSATVDYGSLPGKGGSGMMTPPPVPMELAPQDARTWGMLCHLLALCGLLGIPFGTILGPLVIWLIKKNEFAFVDDQGKEAINFHISVVIIAIILSPTICLAGIGILLLIALGLGALVLSIIAAVKANQGIYYRYPFALRLIK